jgi:fucose permease
MGAFVALFFLYTGAEGTIGGWQATHLIATGRSESAAASFSGLFWGALAVGRFLVVPISLRVSPERLVVFAQIAALLFVQLANVPAFAPAAYALVGLALAPIFPCSLVWLLRSAPGARGMTALVLIGASLGGAVFPTLVGRWLAMAGPRALPASVATILGAGLLFAFAIRLRVAGGAAGRAAPVESAR